jgi:hypothetical protein
LGKHKKAFYSSNKYRITVSLCVCHWESTKKLFTVVTNTALL